VLTGVLVTVGALLLWRSRPSSWLNDTALVVLVIMGLGKILLGFAPKNTDVGLLSWARRTSRSAAWPYSCSAW
jgi:hypothetical protein